MSKEKNQEVLRHSAAHVLALAVFQMFPDAKFGIGPATDDGFYYDFDLPRTLIPEDLPLLEEKMREIIKADFKIEKAEASVEKAKDDFVECQQPYKVELINDLKEQGEKEVGLYKIDGFVDLCKGPHLDSTGKINPEAFKLTRISGAYWKSDEKNKQLQRIYGVVFEDREELDEYLKMREEAAERDHKKLGRELDLFSFHPEAPGSAFWHPKGLIIMEKLSQFWRQVHERAGYIEVRTPILLTTATWKQSGHLDFFYDKMYMAKTSDSEEYNYAIKPMNCDGGILIYKDKQRSYKDLPIRMGELGLVHRYEASGEVHGLLRVREFTQDDAHIYCTKEQAKDEIIGVMHLCFDFYKIFGLDLDHIELSTRPEKSIGSDEVWEIAEKTLLQILKDEKVKYQINEGDGAFYGPKLDFHLKDSMGRTWQCATIQLDFSQPENFELEYIDEKGEKVRPVMIHRVIYGSMERFLGVLLEHYGGLLPLWLAPEQVRIIPISDKFVSYAEKVKLMLANQGILVTVDSRNETMQSRIRDAEQEKVPYMLIVGEKEKSTGTVSVRPNSKKDLGILKNEEFLKLILDEIQTKKNAGL